MTGWAANTMSGAADLYLAQDPPAWGEWRDVDLVH